MTRSLPLGRIERAGTHDVSFAPTARRAMEGEEG